MKDELREAMVSSLITEWYTPEKIMLLVYATFNTIPDLDPCGTHDHECIVRARKRYTIKDDGLVQPWTYEGRPCTVYMNPPYGREVPKWADKLQAEIARSHVLSAISLVAARVDTKWFRTLVEGATICFLKSRLTFIGAPSPALFPSALVYHGSDHDRYMAVIRRSGIGWLCRKE